MPFSFAPSAGSKPGRACVQTRAKVGLNRVRSGRTRPDLTRPDQTCAAFSRPRRNLGKHGQSQTGPGSFRYRKSIASVSMDVQRSSEMSFKVFPRSRDHFGSSRNLEPEPSLPPPPSSALEARPCACAAGCRRSHEVPPVPPRRRGGEGGLGRRVAPRWGVGHTPTSLRPWDGQSAQALRENSVADRAYVKHLALVSAPGAGAWLLAQPAPDGCHMEHALYGFALSLAKLSRCEGTTA